jgi:hypothetical protein
MKRLLFAAMMVTATTAFAAENDTLIIEKPQRVTIITSDSLQSIRVKGKEGDNHFDYQNTIQLIDSNYVSTETYNKSLWDLMPFGQKNEDDDDNTELVMSLAAGFCTAVGTPDGISIPVGPSWEIDWTIAEFRYRLKEKMGHYLSVGFGLDWRNYRMTNQHRFVKDDNGNISVEGYPNGSNPKFSRIKVLSLTVPFQYHYYLKGNSFIKGFSFGPVLNFNTYSSIKTRYSVNGEKQKEFAKDLHKNPVTVDFMVKLRMKYFGFYAKYSPCNVLDTTYGPKFKSMSFGVCF